MSSLTNTNMKIGQTVRCINARDSEYLNTDFHYEIIDVNQYGNIRLSDKADGEKSTHYYKPSRFLLVKEKVVVETININKEYRTRCGCKVKIYTVDGDDEAYPIVGVINEGVGWTNAQWTENGRYFKNATENQWDLFEVKQEVEFKTSVKGIKVQIFRDGSALLSQNVDAITINGQALKEIVAAYKEMHGEKSLD